MIKIERPGAGDDSRAFGPPWLKDRAGKDTRDSAYFTSANRGKKSVTVDIAAAEGQALVRELARRCDVLIENYKFGDLARYGLGYDDLQRAQSAASIYCSVTGFGQTGPYRERPGYDFMIQGMGGLMSVTGERDGAPGGGPQSAGVPIADIITGMYASIAICAALAHRERNRAGPAPRPGAARLAGRAARQPEHQLLRDRRAAASASATRTRTSCRTSRSAPPTAT